MSVFNGRKINVEIYGESHSEKIGVKVTGLDGSCFDENKLFAFLERRKASNAVYSTPRKEPDVPVFSGVENGVIKTTLQAEIYNTNVKSKDYSDLYGKPRPSYADYAWHLKDGTLDFSGGGRFSGRLTAPFCVVGGICKQILEQKGIYITAYVSSIGTIKGRSYKDGDFSLADLEKLKGEAFPSITNQTAMLGLISAAHAESDSVGGVIECIVKGFPAGYGDNLFGGLEGKIASVIYAVPAVKGVEFGAGFDGSKLYGSTANDQLFYNGDAVCFTSNNSGGINGGISNGNYISLAAAIKPTASISKAQHTVDLVSHKNTEIKIRGRHDSCIVPRAVPVIESAVAIALLDEIL